ncbi:MAG: D-proline reductase (dithiol) PrdB [Myxococcota bacterium]|jgi:D-proline reductase (dithiol) PrdB
MATLSELSGRDRRFVEGYAWRRIHPTPWSVLGKPLSESRVALISTAGMVGADQEPFSRRVRGGDVSFRVLPAETDLSTLRLTHKSKAFSPDGILSDANLALPLDRLRELAAEGRIGSVSPRHLSFMGSITAPGRLVHRTAPSAVDALVEDGADIALLVPV